MKGKEEEEEEDKDDRHEDRVRTASKGERRG
jgi:hypothetical protein